MSDCFQDLVLGLKAIDVFLLWGFGVVLVCMSPSSENYHIDYLG